MARVSLDSSAVHTLDRDAGNDPAALTGDTITTGAGNGFTIPYSPSSVLVLQNGTGGSATVTVKTVVPATVTAVSLTVADKSLTVADGTELLYPMSAIFRQSDGNIYLDCDVAIDVAVISL